MKLVEEIAERGEDFFGSEAIASLKACLQCGKCTGSCPSGRITALRTRKIFSMTLLNLKERILSSDELWFCTTCYTCYERCPRGVKTTDIIRLLRNIAAKDGYMAKSHKKIASFIINTGHTVPINEEIEKTRESLGLEPVAPTTQRYEEGLSELQYVMKENEFDKIIGFDWEKRDIKEEEE